MIQQLGILDRLTELADPTRGRILCALQGQELTVAELQAVLQLPQSTVSRHLKVLGRGGWVASRAHGASHRYRLRPDGTNGDASRLWEMVQAEVATSRAVQLDNERLGQVLAERRHRSREFFSSEAGRWDNLRAELFGDRYELQALLGFLDSRWVVGDLGCGAGQLSLAIAPFVERVIAVDESPEMLDAARVRLAEASNVECRHGELELLPVSEAELDAAFVVLVLPYVVDPGRVLAEAARALQAGGRLLVLDLQAHDRTEYEQTMGHVWMGFQAGRILDWLTGAGLIGARYVPLPASQNDKGPGLFIATAHKPG